MVAYNSARKDGLKRSFLRISSRRFTILQIRSATEMRTATPYLCPTPRAAYGLPVLEIKFDLKLSEFRMGTIPEQVSFVKTQDFTTRTRKGS